MCGINGFAGTLYSQDELQHYTLQSCEKLKHRGPDATAVFIKERVALGATRLSIQDISQGHQPMTCGTHALVYNGELYNAPVLKEMLVRRGYTFETASDTEVVLAMLLEFDTAAFEKFEGMFALAYWNGHSLLLARDRWGEKPLYYSCSKESLTFASEIKGLKPWPHLEWDISEDDLMHFLKNSYLPHPRTGWKGIQKLEPGTFLRFQHKKIHIERYYTPALQSFKTDPQELFQLLSTSVQNCLISDRPIGAFLSGGLDSSSIAYFLSKYRPQAPVFSLHWDDPAYSEEHYTTTLAKALNLNHHSVLCDPTFFMNHFDTIVDHYDEPFGDESMIPTYCLAQFAKEHVDVVLTGDGADEFFHGYERYFFDGDPLCYLDTFSATPSSTMHLICPDAQEPPILGEKGRARSFLDIHTYLPNDILTKVDRACMAASLESRAPFLTPSITNFALKCSMEALTEHSSRGKEILRAAMHDHLPPLILGRKKMGFGVPLRTWLPTSLREWMRTRLLDGSLKNLDWISRAGLETLLQDPGRFTRPLFNLLVLERWILIHAIGETSLK